MEVKTTNLYVMQGMGGIFPRIRKTQDIRAGAEIQAKLANMSQYPQEQYLKDSTAWIADKGFVVDRQQQERLMQMAAMYKPKPKTAAELEREVAEKELNEFLNEDNLDPASPTFPSLINRIR